MAAFQFHNPALEVEKKGGSLAASIFSTVNSKRLIPASLLLARLASMVE